MANVRIKDIQNTATSAAADDYLAIDGATSGTRKILAKDLQTETDTTLTVSGKAADAKVVGDNITNLKSEINDISDVVIGKNVFDQADATITSGKYLNYSNGNEGANVDYCYVNDYIPLKANTKYFISCWYQSTEEFAGNYGGFILFYDSSKTFISGLSSQYSITTPNDCAYARLSLSLAGWNRIFYMVEEGESKSDNYEPYSARRIVKKVPSYIYVDANGRGDFTSIQDAVDAANEGDSIFISAGEYYESVSTWHTENGSIFGKRVNLIGLDKDNTILYYDSNNYSTPPLEFSNGSIRNITIYAKDGGNQTEATSCYAMHMETHSLYGKSCLFENVMFKSEVNYPIGIGLRGGGASLVFKNCDFIGVGASAGCIWFHDADASAYRGTCNITFDTCNMICNGNNYPIRINAMHDDNLTYITFKRNIVWAKTNETSNIYNTWNTGGVSGDGWRGLLKMYLTYDSVLNSESGMNYSR